MVGFVTSLRTARSQAIVDAIGASGLLRIYDGTRPATGGTATTLLAELPLSATAGTVSNGVLTFNTITSDTVADATGTATWARVTTSAGAAVADFSVGTSGTEIILDSVSVVAGGTVAVSSGVLTEGNA